MLQGSADLGVEKRSLHSTLEHLAERPLAQLLLNDDIVGGDLPLVEKQWRLVGGEWSQREGRSSRIDRCQSRAFFFVPLLARKRWYILLITHADTARKPPSEKNSETLICQ